ncbi:MAG TPA: hypothetical protein VE889_03070, partial [Actinomycetota bacterium]|nr:hypothetical protein [Actinomycetota bacterium]
VVTDRPGRVKDILEVKIARPRSGRSIRHLPEYVELRDRIWDLLAKDPVTSDGAGSPEATRTVS